jgi:hypothetical protein
MVATAETPQETRKGISCFLGVSLKSSINARISGRKPEESLVVKTGNSNLLGY